MPFGAFQRTSTAIKLAINLTINPFHVKSLDGLRHQPEAKDPIMVDFVHLNKLPNSKCCELLYFLPIIMSGTYCWAWQYNSEGVTLSFMRSQSLSLVTSESPANFCFGHAFATSCEETYPYVVCQLDRSTLLQSQTFKLLVGRAIMVRLNYPMSVLNLYYNSQKAVPGSCFSTISNNKKRRR